MKCLLLRKSDGSKCFRYTFYSVFEENITKKTQLIILRTR